MKTLQAVLLLALAGIASAQSVQIPERAPGYAPLENFVGSWTTKGRESQFKEECHWYHGNFHVVCNSETRRTDGSTGHSMSILSFVPDSGYVYSGIGSKGRYETFEKGLWSDGRFVFDSVRSEAGKEITDRITIGPFTESGFEFVVTSTSDGTSWTELGRTTYVRIKR